MTNPVSDTFDITKGVLGGYNPATQMLIGAELWFAISDDLDPRRSEWVRIDLETGLGLQSFLNPSELDFGPFVNGQVSGDALATLDATGTLKYFLTATSGDFWFSG